MAISSPALPNFRDVGGLVTTAGEHVRRGLLYRSVALDQVADDDLAGLASLGLRTVFDLRTGLERSLRPDRPLPGAEYLPLDLLMDSGEADPAAYFELVGDPPRASVELANGGTERFYLATYRDLVRLPSARAGLARFYRTLADADHRPGLVHCTTGKDRTGWAVAALLLLLGVDRDEVMRDYLVSDGEIRRAYQPFLDDFLARGGRREVVEPMMGVRPAFLDEALAAMLADYGSVDDYLGVGLGLDREVTDALRLAFLA